MNDFKKEFAEFETDLKKVMRLEVKIVMSFLKMMTSSLEVDGITSTVGVLLKLKIFSGQAKWIQHCVT